MINNSTTDQWFVDTVYSGKPYKTRCRIYSVNWGQNPIDLWNEAEVVTYGTLLRYNQTDTDSNRRITQKGIEMTDFFVKSGSRYTLGNFTSRSIKVSFINDDGAMSSFDWDQVAVVYIDVYNNDHGWISVPFGVYKWERPFSTLGKIVDATANDLACELEYIIDDTFNAITWSNGVSMYDLLMTYLNGFMGVTVDPDLADSTDSANPKNLYLLHTLKPFTASGLTCRNLVAMIAEACGANAIIDRTGVLRLKNLREAKDGGSPVSRTVLFRTDTTPSMIKKYTLSEETASPPLFVQTNSTQIGGTGAYPTGVSDRPMNVIDNALVRPVARLNTFAKNIWDFNLWGVPGAFGPFNYGTVELLEYDWRVEAGDIVGIGRMPGGVQVVQNYVPVFKQVLKWQGGPVKAVLSNWGEHDWQSATKADLDRQDISYRIYEAGQSGGGGGGGADPATVPASASIDSDGLITFKNSSSATLFTLQLPVYGGA